MEEVNVKMIVKSEKETATMSKNSEAVKKYYSENCTEFKIRAINSEGEVIKAYAASCGCSAQSLFLAAVKYYMELGLVPDAVKRGRKKREETK